MQEEVEAALPGAARDHRLANDDDNARRITRVRQLKEHLACQWMDHRVLPQCQQNLDLFVQIAE